MTETGKLIVFEGPDGVGKTALAHKVTDHLTRIGTSCCYYAFPGREIGSLGWHVYNLHHDPARFDVQKINPTSLQLLHVAAHIDAIEHKILPMLKAGQSVILDRFWWSTWVYGVAGGARPQSLRSMLKTERMQWADTLPSVVFLISRTEPLRMEYSPDRWNELCRIYNELADEEKKSYPVEIIRNQGEIDDAVQQIINSIVGKVIAPPIRSIDQIEQKDNIDEQRVNTSVNQPIGVPTIFTKLSPVEPTEVYDTYWHFAVERQAIFFRRLKGESQPWTSDPILSRYKFTNAYRASDRVSQYLIQNVVYTGEVSENEVFFRVLLFKIFNRIETWELLQKELGVISYSDYSFERYDKILSDALSANQTIFSAAYIMPSGKYVFGYSRKHRDYLRLLELMIKDSVPTRIAEARSMRTVFELLRSYPLIGDFLAYQYTIDINYSELTDFSEMEFVVPGPGAKDGIRKCFHSLGGLNEADLIRLVANRQHQEFERLGLRFENLWGRPLQLIDCQNLFCEVDKYARIAHPDIRGISGRTRIKQKYQPNPTPLHYWYPPKWGINHLVHGG